MTKRTKILLIVAALFVAIQFYPVNRGNPPVQNDITAPADVKAVLKTACYDCHSHETEWPWYSYVAPVSWLVAHDVEEGRAEMNFSRWSSYSGKDRSHFREEICEEIEEGEMPLPVYLITHPDAELTDAQKQLIRQWSQAGDAYSGHKERPGEDEYEEKRH